MKINSSTILTALFASPCRHSISPIMHNEAFNKLNLNYIYLAFEVDKNNLKDAVNSIKTLNMRGVNLSMPNKKCRKTPKKFCGFLPKNISVSLLKKSVDNVLFLFHKFFDVIHLIFSFR